MYLTAQDGDLYERLEYLLMIASANSLTLLSGMSQPMKKGRMRYLAQASVMIDADELFSTRTDVQV